MIDDVLFRDLEGVFEGKGVLTALLDVEPVSLDFFLQIRHNEAILSPGCGLRKWDVGERNGRKRYAGQLVGAAHSPGDPQTSGVDERWAKET